MMPVRDDLAVAHLRPRLHLFPLLASRLLELVVVPIDTVVQASTRLTDVTIGDLT